MPPVNYPYTAHAHTHIHTYIHTFTHTMEDNPALVKKCQVFFYGLINVVFDNIVWCLFPDQPDRSHSFTGVKLSWRQSVWQVTANDLNHYNDLDQHHVHWLPVFGLHVLGLAKLNPVFLVTLLLPVTIGFPRLILRGKGVLFYLLYIDLFLHVKLQKF